VWGQQEVVVVVSRVLRVSNSWRCSETWL
jgi:hypothetical protein